MRLRSLAAVATLALPLALPAAALADMGLAHDWRPERDGTVLISRHIAPPPFSVTGEAEATLTMEAAPLGNGKPTLEGIVKDQIEGIRGAVDLADYLEHDGHQVDRGIASWFQTVAGTRVGFVKYRVAGRKGQRLPAPRTVIHAIAVKGELVYLSHLYVVFAGHQDEVRGDQLRMIEAALLARKPGSAR
jgi:hypothetical protein